MLAKRNQLRAELRGHLAKVIQERGLSASVDSDPFGQPSAGNRPRVASEPSEEYAQLLYKQQDAAEQRSRAMETSFERDGEQAWYDEHRSDNPRRLRAEEQRLILQKQIEEKRKRRAEEEKRRAAEDALWEEWAMQPGPLSKFLSSPSSTKVKGNSDWHTLLYRNRQQVSRLERELDSITRQLVLLKEEQSRILEHVNTNTPERQSFRRRIVSPQRQYPLEEQVVQNDSRVEPLRVSSSTETKRQTRKEAYEETFSSAEESNPLPITARYYVYVTKPRSQISPNPSTAAHDAQNQEVNGSQDTSDGEEDNRSVVIEPALQKPLTLREDDGDSARLRVSSGFASTQDLDQESDDDEDDDEEEEVEFKKIAAIGALARADESSGDEGVLYKGAAPIHGINTFLEADVPYDIRGTPQSKFSTNSFDT